MPKTIKLMGMGMGLLLLAPVSLWAKAAGTPAPAAVKPARAASGLDSLMTEYREEISAQAKYQAFAEKARAEGYLKVAKLFRAAAMTEGLHAARHAKTIKDQGGEPQAAVVKPKTGTTRQNLEATIAGMAEPEPKASAKNEQAAAAEEAPPTVDSNLKKLFSQALAELPAWKADGDFYVCQVCGNVVAKLDFQYCPICKAPVSAYKKVK